MTAPAPQKTSCCAQHGDCSQGDYCPVRMAAAAAADHDALNNLSAQGDGMSDYQQWLQEMAFTLRFAACLFGLCFAVGLAWPWMR